MPREVDPAKPAEQIVAVPHHMCRHPRYHVVSHAGFRSPARGQAFRLRAAGVRPYVPDQRDGVPSTAWAPTIKVRFCRPLFFPRSFARDSVSRMFELRMASPCRPTSLLLRNGSGPHQHRRPSGSPRAACPRTPRSWRHCHSARPSCCTCSTCRRPALSRDSPRSASRRGAGEQGVAVPASQHGVVRRTHRRVQGCAAS